MIREGTMNGKINQATEGLKSQLQFFQNVTSILTEEDSGFRPTPEMRTIAQMICHTWRTIKWFSDAVFTDNGFSMDFEGDERETQKATSVKQELASLKAEFERSIELWGGLPDEELMTLLPDNPIIGPVPKVTIVSSCIDHTAHHRGALSVYIRLLGKVPPMPYMAPEAQKE